MRIAASIARREAWRGGPPTPAPVPQAEPGGVYAPARLPRPLRRRPEAGEEDLGHLAVAADAQLRDVVRRPERLRPRADVPLITASACSAGRCTTVAAPRAIRSV